MHLSQALLFLVEFLESNSLPNGSFDLEFNPHRKFDRTVREHLSVEEFTHELDHNERMYSNLIVLKWYMGGPGMYHHYAADSVQNLSDLVVRKFEENKKVIISKGMLISAARYLEYSSDPAVKNLIKDLLDAC